MENHHSSASPTNNANYMSKEDLVISANHINKLPISAVFSNNNNNSTNNGDHQINSAEEIEAYINSFPPGFRFCPTDDELITHYLKRKLDNLPLQPNKIYEMNIYKYNPETIAAHVKPTTAEKVWYILTPRDRKYRNGSRPSRSAGDGYWKATGADKPIMDHTNKLIGLKKALVFYIGKAPKGNKTDWIMHEYRVPEIPKITSRDAHDWTLDEWVLCKIYKKSDRNNTMCTQRKRSREDYECVDEEIVDTCDGGQVQVHESPNENLSSHDELHDTFSEVAGQNYIANNLTNDNHATTTTFHPQVSARFSNFPQSSYTSWSSSILHEGGTSMRNDRFPHQHVPSPISSAVRGTNSSIGHDHTMKSEGFGTPGFSSSINGGYTSQEYYEFNSNADKRDPMECVDEYLVHNYDWVDEYLVNNCEISKSKGDC